MLILTNQQLIQLNNLLSSGFDENELNFILTLLKSPTFTLPKEQTQFAWYEMDRVWGCTILEGIFNSLVRKNIITIEEGNIIFIAKTTNFPLQAFSDALATLNLIVSSLSSTDQTKKALAGTIFSGITKAYDNLQFLLGPNKNPLAISASSYLITQLRYALQALQKMMGNQSNTEEIHISLVKINNLVIQGYNLLLQNYLNNPSINNNEKATTLGFPAQPNQNNFFSNNFFMQLITSPSTNLNLNGIETIITNPQETGEETILEEWNQLNISDWDLTTPQPTTTPTMVKPNENKTTNFQGTPLATFSSSVTITTSEEKLLEEFFSGVLQPIIDGIGDTSPQSFPFTFKS